MGEGEDFLQGSEHFSSCLPSSLSFRGGFHGREASPLYFPRQKDSMLSLYDLAYWLI